MDRETFRDPGVEYRAVPFWSWNDWLEDDELVRQIDEMEKAGWGGFFMHSRLGLKTPYMTPEWMDRIRTCVEEARRRGMHAWLYDEDKWPSGFAGGMTALKDADYRMRVLACRVFNRYDTYAESVAEFAGHLNGDKLTDVRLVDGQQDDAHLTYLQFHEWIAPLGSDWFNGAAYSDQLSVEGVREFITNTYAAYHEVLGDDFGTVVPGMFTDEPNFCSFHQEYPEISVPWTKGFARIFEEKFGYDLIPHLPSLFFDTGDYRKVRYHYWRAITEQFVEAYSKQIYEWCDAHNLKLTGHYLYEDSLQQQIPVSGAVMPHYEYMHYPGIDHLRRNIADLVTPKQLDSVVCQLGKERALSETYGCSGQNLSFEGRKWIGDWQCVLGINFLNPHLSSYTLRGARKRDYPPDIFYQQPWWPHNALIDDYYARLSYALSQGERVVDLLVVHPIGSAWSVFRPQNPQAARAINDPWVALSTRLLEEHFDYHFGDESIMARHARVEDDCLVVGRMRYRVVIVPPSITLASTTVEILQAFRAAGGVVFFCDEKPTLIEGDRDDTVDGLIAACETLPLGDEPLAATLEPHLARPVRVTSGGGSEVPHVWYNLRRNGIAQTLFLANTSQDEGGNYTVHLPDAGSWQVWDAATGEVQPLPAQDHAGNGAITLPFAPVGSYLLVSDTGGQAGEAATAPNYTYSVDAGATWNLELLDPNALTLDYCAYRIADGEWLDPVPHLKALEILRRAGTLEHVRITGTGVPFAVQYTFESGLSTGHDLTLVLERPDEFRISVNGTAVEHNPSDGYWLDTTFRRIPIGSLARAGTNTIMLEGVTSLDMEIEACYIIGDFGVEETGDGFRLVAAPTQAQSGDLTHQGLPFFAGRVRLTQEVHVSRNGGAAALALEGLDATVTIARVNGKEAGTLVWRPHELDISSLLVEGENTLELELVGTLHNLLGPHHHQDGEILAVSPATFSDWLNWTDDYTFVRFGVDRASIRLE